MDLTDKIHAKFKKILRKLKSIGIIEKFKLEINFCQVEGNLKRSLLEVDSVLKKCLRKIINKPKRAEIRNIITELVRKKNLNDIIIKEPVRNILPSKSSYGTECIQNKVNPFAIKCCFCKEILTSKKNLVMHKKKPEKYLCEKCGKVFCDIQKWKTHEKEYNQKPLPCLEMTNLASDLKDKILNNGNDNFEVLPPEGQMRSEVVFGNLLKETEKENSSQKSNLKNHVLIKREKIFTCGCGKVFKVLKTLRKHERLKHSFKNIKHTCIICGKSFIEKGKLNRHMLSHKDRQYHCSFCTKQFSRSDTLKRHTSLFHCTPKEFFCSFCHKNFKLKYNRDIHEKNVHKNVNNWIQCEHCGQKFRNKNTLKGHLKTHSQNEIILGEVNHSPVKIFSKFT